LRPSVQEWSVVDPETKTPIEPTLDHGRRVDYEYERAGTANIFMFTEPLSSWREVAVRERKTKIDWAVEMARLPATRTPPPESSGV